MISCQLLPQIKVEETSHYRSPRGRGEEGGGSGERRGNRGISEGATANKGDNLNTAELNGRSGKLHCGMTNILFSPPQGGKCSSLIAG